MHGGKANTDSDCKLYALQAQLPDTAKDWRNYYVDSLFREQLEALANSDVNAIRAQALVEFLNHDFPVGVYYLPENYESKSQNNIAPSEEAISISLEAGFINIYPNPAGDFLTINFDGIDLSASDFDVNIIGITGQVVEKVIIDTKEQKISVKQLDQGIYSIILFKNGSQFASRKLIISRQ